MPVDLRAQVVHHPLADDVGEPGLADAQHAGGDRDADHPADQGEQQLVAVLGDRVVEHVAQQERRDHPQDRRDGDQDQDDDQPAPVGPEEPNDPAGQARRPGLLPRRGGLGGDALPGIASASP